MVNIGIINSSGLTGFEDGVRLLREGNRYKDVHFIKLTPTYFHLDEVIKADESFVEKLKVSLPTEQERNNFFDYFSEIEITPQFMGLDYGFSYKIITKDIFRKEQLTKTIVEQEKRRFGFKKEVKKEVLLSLEELCGENPLSDYHTEMRSRGPDKFEIEVNDINPNLLHLGIKINSNDDPRLNYVWNGYDDFLGNLLEEGKKFEQLIDNVYKLKYKKALSFTLFLGHPRGGDIKKINLREISNRSILDIKTIREKDEMKKIAAEIQGIDELTHKIGEGGNRECYSGLMQGKPVVVSIMKEDRIRKDAWQNEIDAFWELNHEAIIGYVHNPGTLTDGRPYIIMKQFGKGENLEDYVLKHGPLTMKQFKKVFYGDEEENIPGVISGLHHAHKKGIYHQDLTLKNILIETDEKDKIVRAKIGDWESARFLGKEQEQEVHESLGSPAYVLNSLSDEEKDKFSLGVCMYVAFTGFNPLLGVPFQKAKTGNSAENRSKLVTKMQETYEQLKTDLDMQKQMGNRLGKSLWVGSYRHILGLINQNEGFCHLPTDSSGLDISDPDHERRVKEYFAANELPA